MNLLRTLALVLLGLLIIKPSHSQQQRATPTPNAELRIDQLMTAKEFRDSGLVKLDASEIAALNKWLMSYSVRLMQRTGATGSVIESQMDGEFTGWDGETIFKLANGQIWQQTSYAYTYHYAYRPRVFIYNAGGGYKMKVDGVSGEISVRQLR